MFISSSTSPHSALKDKFLLAASSSNKSEGLKECHITEPSRPKLSTSERQAFIKQFQKERKLSEITLSILKTSKRSGQDTKTLNHEIIRTVLEESSHVNYVTKIKPITDQLHQIRIELIQSGKIEFNKEEKIWCSKKLKVKALTEKEKRFLKAKKLGTGWVNISHKLDAIEWLHEKLSDDEFEQFCCALLKHCNVNNVRVTEKRKSGADGGLDGFGDYKLENEADIIPIAFEAKRHAVKSQIGSDICQKLAGAMMENDIEHGFIITTAKFSDRAKKSVQKMEQNKGFQIELIDQDRMADIMIYKKDSPHGFGLHRTDIDRIYMNKKILKDSVGSS